ncbi:hypothetical protein ABZ656_07000 [Streptomyces sp. NPDC007095]|uniref:hypothetical protein n=1 Tax=Streptomyces sp. NPDC007095 TaxID=3154482 RepID=UPI000CC2ACFE
MRHILPNGLTLIRGQAVTSLGTSLMDLDGSPWESPAAGFTIILVAFNMAR